jgi:hypothetical protein
MGGMNPIQLGGYGNPNAPSGGPLGFLSDLIGGIHDGNRQRKEDKATDDAAQQLKTHNAQEIKMNDFKLKQGEAEMTAATTKAAVERVSNMTPLLFKNPSSLSDPTAIKTWKEGYAAQGLPAPMTKDGKIDPSSLKKNFTDLDGKTQQFYLSLPVEQRKPILEGLAGQGYDIPKEMFSTKAYVTAKDQAALAGIANRVGHEHAWEGIMNKRMALQNRRDTAMDAKDYATINEIDAKTQLYKAQIPAIGVRLQQAQQRIGLQAQGLQNAMTRFSASPHGAQSQLLGAAKGALNTYTAVNREYTDALNKRELMVENNVDSDDPGFVELNQEIENLGGSDGKGGQLGQLKELHDNAVTALTNGTATAGAVSSASGNKVTPMNSGKQVQGSDGHTYQKQSNGKWKVIS